MDISENDFVRFQVFLKATCGIALSDNKKYLISNRLSSLLKSSGVASFSELVSMIEAELSGNLASKVIDAMTTNETFWFRDERQFALLENKVFSELSSKVSNIKVWSAACSSGQESYSISLSFENFLKRQRVHGNIRISATDISEKTVSQGRKGVYADIELERGLPDELKVENFARIRDGWQISIKHRDRMSFKTFNLLEDYKSLGKFDVIFCRNVLIYFATPTKVDILNRLKESLNPGGYLFLSSSEIIPRDVSGFETVREMSAKCYRKIA